MGHDERRGGGSLMRAGLVCAGLGALVAGLTGCGSPGQSAAGSPTGSAPTATVSGSPAGPGTPAGSGSASASSTGIPAAATAGAPLPGSSFDRGPSTGQRLAVIGVAAGRSIPVQVAPGPGQKVLTTVTPQVGGLVAAGRARLVEPAGGAATVWVLATVSGVTGWIDGGHVAAPAATTDLTADAIGRLGSRPVDATMLALGMHVAQAYASTEPPSTITVVVAPTVGDLGEMTVDVVGLGDDSVAGQRLHVFGTPSQGSFTLKSVEATPFCYRGVGASGLCV
jgi:hypothetical protein